MEAIMIAAVVIAEFILPILDWCDSISSVQLSSNCISPAGWSVHDWSDRYSALAIQLLISSLVFAFGYLSKN